MQIQELNLTDTAIFEQEVQRRIVDSNCPLSLFIVDMGGISKIFARSGREANKAFLGTVAKLLVRVCRESDFVCRIGDSSFGIVFDDMKSPVLQQLAAEKIIRLYKAAVEEMDASFQANISIGIANFPEHGDDADQLMHNSRLALEAAQAKGEPYFVYSADTVATMALKWNLQGALAAAIKNIALDVFYQPKIDLATGRVVGAEALLRWTDCNHGTVPPDVFVPLACEIGMINELTNFVLTTALRNASEWPSHGGRLGVSVNLEAQTLQKIDLDEVIKSSLSIWGSDKTDLTLEITETALVADSKADFQRLNKLRSMGIGISVDDFGTGYSSLSYFTSIPATELKIDKAFIDNMCTCEKSHRLVETIISLAHRFDLTVVAEGVETEEQVLSLKELRCDVIQGYYVSEAISHGAFCRWLANR